MAVIRRPSDGALLVSAAPGDDFVRPLGGHVELGELAVDAVRREIDEELGRRLDDVVLLGVLENRFELHGELGHEVVFVYDATFADAASYELDDEPILDDRTGTVRVEWLERADGRRLVPHGLAALIDDDPGPG